MTATTTVVARYKRNGPRGGGRGFTASYLLTDSTTIVAGALVSLTQATSKALNATDAASEKFAGVCTKTVTSGSSNTTVYCEVEYGHEELFTTDTSLAALVGTMATVKDNNTVTSAASTNDMQVGEIIEVLSTTQAWIKVRSPEVPLT
ncbi:MAG: hypothetical protein WC211_00800 [Dehalococcoidia bacterium]